MKILAIEEETGSKRQNNIPEVLKQEAAYVYMLQKQNILREIYFNDDKCAVLILECKNKTEAELILNKLPLVRQKYICFKINELYPYNGLDRILRES